MSDDKRKTPASNDASEAGVSTRVSLRQRLALVLMSLLLLATAGLFSYLIVARGDSRMVRLFLTPIAVGVAICALFGAVALAHAFRSYAFWGPMRARRFMRLTLGCYILGLSFFLLSDGFDWLRQRSWLLMVLACLILAVVWTVAGKGIFRGMQWLAFGDSAPPEKPAS